MAAGGLDNHQHKNTRTHKHKERPNIMKITVEYGTGNQATLEVPDGTSIDAALASARGALGFGASVEAHIDSVPQPADAPVADGDTLQVHDKACSKAAGR
jgi:hypothetical protein